MKYLKTYEKYDDIVYKLDDIVVCSTKKDEWNDYQGYINQHGKFSGKQPIYGRKYKIVDIYWYGNRYSKVPKSHYYYYKVDIQNLKTGKIKKNFDANLFTLASKWKQPDEPMVGDYVVCEVGIEEINEFIKDKVGRYVQPTLNEEFTIQYRNVPEYLSDGYYVFWNTTNPYIKDLANINLIRKNIKFYSNNKEEVEDYIERNKNVSKYNL